MKNYRGTKLAALVAAAAMTVSGAALAAVSEVDGAGGGGIVPWALLSGDDAKSDYGAVASYTFINTDDFTVHSAGAAVKFHAPRRSVVCALVSRLAFRTEHTAGH